MRSNFLVKHRVSFWGDEIILELIVGMVKHYKYIKCYCIVHFQMVHFMLYDFHFNF